MADVNRVKEYFEMIEITSKKGYYSELEVAMLLFQISSDLDKNEITQKLVDEIKNKAEGYDYLYQESIEDDVVKAINDLRNNNEVKESDDIEQEEI